MMMLMTVRLVMTVLFADGVASAVPPAHKVVISLDIRHMKYGTLLRAVLPFQTRGVC